ncbi:23S rRNA (pseudouridine(1915)-N(3))-methyltransferase RlmH [Skermanella rosea]|uniref:Ribosomal RNA large subunit methyltransferase H n=1 Tax=Skermanella cutis TaxID=2775420 RepID=A0ABX7B2J7_9PROT|nr:MULTISPECIES: 23S rRNA (pseudouridine(1915)-N(3))-methyltransferase RlmH [Skermanella]QQP88559.1 23S rRNA (pseudouridine(1915)-N(3))-methyltransferase RlmH [Skermanella sp. TT6]UEM02599.1 23S rRNA (pseudouridine(1915)-N(3))-methyltransferase RlmH [Skermanella rosea]
MKIWLAAVGRARAGAARDLYEEYARRMTWPLVLKEVESKKRVPPDELKRLEADLLLSAVPNAATIVALDERGAALSSERFAEKLGGWRDTGVGDVAFLIGGADGHGEAVAKRADLMLALGPMTWPHLMVRAMLAEQLYRAQQILAGHPYHRA